MALPMDGGVSSRGQNLDGNAMGEEIIGRGIEISGGMVKRGVVDGSQGQAGTEFE